MIKICLIILLQFSWAKDKLASIVRSSSVANESSILITRVDGETVLDWNSNVVRTPASLTKLAIAGAVYDQLSLDTKWQSQLVVKESKTNSKVENLCFRAGGDPAFVSESMWVLVNHFLRSGINEIEKDIIVDESIFDNDIFDKGRGDTRVSRAYDAPVSAASFNWNSVNIYVKPTSVGSQVKLTMDPESEYFTVENNVKTVRGSVNQLKQGLSFDRLSVSEKGETIRLKGSLGEKNDEAVVFRSVAQPALWLGYNLKAFLQQRGVQIKGKIKVGSCSSFSNVVASHDSKDLQLIIRDMMKFSNNFVTEMLVKQLSLKISKVGNMQDGKKMIQSFLKSIGVSDFKIESVSGLSYENKVTAASLNKILLHLYDDFNKFEALETLPLAGLDGTLKGRLGKSVKVRAKTGLLSTVVGLAGYAEDSKKNLYSFVMIYNGSDTYKAKDIFDKTLLELVK